MSEFYPENPNGLKQTPENIAAHEEEKPEPVIMGVDPAQEGGDMAVVTVGTAVATVEDKMINSLMELATNPNTDVDKAERFLDMQFKMMDRKAKMEYDLALSELQSGMPRITQNGQIKNKNGQVVAKYMKYEDIDLEIRPRLEEHGFSLKHTREHLTAENKMLVTTTLKHKSGYEESVSIPLPYDKENAMKTELQAAVGTFSVGKRVNVCSMLNIVQEGEDDGARMAEANAITDEQAEHIKTRLEKLYEAGADIDTLRLLKYIGTKSVEEIPAAKFDDVNKLLDRKEDKLKKEGAP